MHLRAVAREDLSDRVDDAIRAAVPHRAPAQRMHADHRTARIVEEGHLRRQQLPQGIAQQPRALAAQAALQRLVAAQDRGLVAQPGPFDLEPARFLEALAPHQPARAAVVADDRQRQVAIRHRRTHREGIGEVVALFMRTGVRARERIERRRQREALVEQRPQRARHRQILDDVIRSRVEDAGDRRSDLPRGGGLVLVGDGVDGARPVMTDRDHVAIGRKALPQHPRHGQAARAGAHQDLGRSQAAGREDHAPREHLERLALAAAQQFVGVLDPDAPADTRDRFEPLDARAADQFRALPPRLQQQAGVERLLGLVVAAGRAVATSDAGPVPPRRRAARPVLHRDLDPRRARARPVERLQRLEPAWLELRRASAQALDGVVARLVPHAEQALGALEPGRHVLVEEVLRPARRAQHRGIGPLHHARIDQRAAAQSVGQRDAHVRPQPQIEKALAPPARRIRAAARQTHVARQVGEAAGERAGQVLAAALQHDHLEPASLRTPPPGQRMRRRGTAIAAAHDQHVHGGRTRLGRSKPRGHPVLQGPRQPARAPRALPGRASGVRRDWRRLREWT